MSSNEHEILSSHGITIDHRQHRAVAGDVPLELTLTEFRLLATFVGEPGRAFSRAELVSAAIGDDSIVEERTIDVHIRSVRKKLGPYAARIETVRGVGYRFSETGPGS